MAREAGESNFFLFGLTAEQVTESRSSYNPFWHYENEPETRAALDLILSDHFSRQSGLFNFLGVMASSGAVAYGIIALLPVELILQVGSSAGFAMVFALLIGAIIWNLGTAGRPASSSSSCRSRSTASPSSSMPGTPSRVVSP
jgi:Carbohydrate phosphorylase